MRESSVHAKASGLDPEAIYGEGDINVGTWLRRRLCPTRNLFEYEYDMNMYG